MAEIGGNFPWKRKWLGREKLAEWRLPKYPAWQGEMLESYRWLSFTISQPLSWGCLSRQFQDSPLGELQEAGGWHEHGFVA